MKYYPFVRNWNRIKPYLSNEKFQIILVRDFNKFTMGRWHQQFKQGMKPFDFESCDWHCERKGRRPAYWDYVKHAASHFLVNKDLILAQLVEPKKEWQIITSEANSTVWDGNARMKSQNLSFEDAVRQKKHFKPKRKPKKT